ncbi:CS domain,HSP20-like chaperone [Cinara cedri]|uniref:CS domain,HSP20-like chaperone n=1 Tax=Cinara cedri TaxID=506608 RepID=A0A5E4NT12_9HEMI|nr:CS domain,HSP20-like chaperone [Cinara cedri]
MQNVPMKTAMPWGQWWQEDEEVYLELNIPRNTKHDEVQIHLSETLPTLIEIVVKNNIIFSDQLLKPVVSDETTWNIRRTSGTLNVMLLKLNYVEGEEPWNTLFNPFPIKNGE